MCLLFGKQNRELGSTIDVGSIVFSMLYSNKEMTHLFWDGTLCDIQVLLLRSKIKYIQKETQQVSKIKKLEPAMCGT